MFDYRMLFFLEWNPKDALAFKKDLGTACLCIPVKAVYGRKPLVSCVNAYISYLLKPCHEASNSVSVEILEFYRFRPYVIFLIEIQKKLFKCIPVGLYGVGAYIPLSRQEIGKIAG